MLGLVLVYRPQLGDGMVVSDAGRRFSFQSESRGLGLRGGDRVTFEALPAGDPKVAEEARILAKSPAHDVAAAQAVLIREFLADLAKADHASGAPSERAAGQA